MNNKKSNITAEQILALRAALLMHIGEENAIHQDRFADRLGIHPATLKKWVNEGRTVYGYWDICSGQAGYWIAKDKTEVRRTEHRITSHALTSHKTTKAMRKHLRETEGQTSIEDFPDKKTKDGRQEGNNGV